MSQPSPPTSLGSWSPSAARKGGLLAAAVTAGAVSWATPDGNLVVTLVPAVAVGLAVYGVILWFSRRKAAR